jgi:hypothetical protein
LLSIRDHAAEQEIMQQPEVKKCGAELPPRSTEIADAAGG